MLFLFRIFRLVFRKIKIDHLSNIFPRIERQKNSMYAKEKINFYLKKKKNTATTKYTLHLQKDMLFHFLPLTFRSNFNFKKKRKFSLLQSFYLQSLSLSHTHTHTRKVKRLLTYSPTKSQVCGRAVTRHLSRA